MTALRYGNCSMSLIEGILETSGRAASSSFLNFARTLGVERRWTVMIWDYDQLLQEKEGL